MNGLRGLLALSFALGVTTLAGAQEKKPDKVACVRAAEEAQSAREQKKLIETRRLLLVCASESCPKAVRTDCASWLEEVGKSLPTVVVRARDASGKDANGKLSVDGKPVEAGAGVAFPLDPGTHALRYELEGGEVIEESLVVAMGEQNRIITLEAKKASPSAERPTPLPRVEHEGKPREKSGGSAMPWILGGIGVAGLATFAVLQLMARGEYSDMKDGCGETKTCSDDELSPIRTKFVASGIALGVGVIGIGTSITWLLLDKPKPTERTGRLEISPGIDSASVRYRVHF